MNASTRLKLVHVSALALTFKISATSSSERVMFAKHFIESCES